jgi:hypothetical protein
MLFLCYWLVMKNIIILVFALILFSCQTTDGNNPFYSQEATQTFGNMSAGQGYGQARANAQNGGVIQAAPQNAPPSNMGCFLKNEQVSGFNKICYYNCTTGMRTLNIQATALCPLSM